MNEAEKYNELMKALGEFIKVKNDEISLLKWKVADLEAKLKAAEAEAGTTATEGDADA